MGVVKLQPDSEGRGNNLVIPKCPGCGSAHYIPIDYKLPNGATWTWNDNENKPSVKPSMHEKVGPWPASWGDRAGQIDVCHFVLTDGRMAFQGDCTHKLRGQTVDLSEII